MATMERIVNRAAEVVGVYGHLRTMPERVDDLALAALAAHAAMQQLELFARWCYETDAHGRLFHLLPSGQLPNGCWAPWGSSGKSGMTRGDRDTLRRWLRILHEKNHKPVWFYYTARRRWYVDLNAYPDLTAAIDWLNRHPIHPQDWLNLAMLGRGR